MAWIEVHQSLVTHRKTLAAADLLDMKPVHLAGHLIAFWLWALDNVPDGNLNGTSPRIIAYAAQWDEDPKRFVGALEDTGFLTRNSAGDLLIHDWHDYAGKLIERRTIERERQRQRRTNVTNINEERTPGVRSTLAQQTQGVAQIYGGTVPNPTVPNHVHVHVDEDPDALFQEFWSAYPRKVAKQAARAAWDKCVKHGTEPQRLIASAGHYAQAVIDSNTESQYILHGATFLGPNRRWEDYEHYKPTGEPPIDYDASDRLFRQALAEPVV